MGPNRMLENPIAVLPAKAHRRQPNTVETMDHMPRRGKISQAQGNALGKREPQWFL
jgi:hypothetical protein